MTSDLNDERDSSSSSSSSSVECADEALCDVLGLPSFQVMTLDVEVDDAEQDPSSGGCALQSAVEVSLEDLLQRTDDYIASIVERYQLKRVYQETSVCTLPPELSVPAPLLRCMTDEVVWHGPERYPQILRTHETVTIAIRKPPSPPPQQPAASAALLAASDNSNAPLIAVRHEHRKVLTRLENLNSHPGWYALCNDYVRRCVRAVVVNVVGDDNDDPLDPTLHLFKTKLNLKPPGTSGFAPHVDTPSLRAALGDAGPQEFVTVMLAIDDMTEYNGCLRVARAPLQCPSSSSSQSPHPPNSNSAVGLVPVVAPHGAGNPDAEGRAGAIPPEVADQLAFEALECSGGTLTVFGGWVPHRSAPNRSPCAPRRAVFVTYNDHHDGGDCHDRYYQGMAQQRAAWNARQQQQQHGAASTSTSIMQGIDQAEWDALSTIPRL